jgi:hypothetical protein
MSSSAVTFWNSRRLSTSSCNSARSWRFVRKRPVNWHRTTLFGYLIEKDRPPVLPRPLS